MNTTLRVAAFAACLLASAPGLRAAGTNDIPYTNSFEQYTNGTPVITLTNDGWYCTDVASILTTNYTYGGTLPLQGVATHTNVLKLDYALTNLLNPDVKFWKGTNVWFDMMLKPNFWEEGYPPDTNTIGTPGPDGAYTMIYFKTNGIDANGYMNVFVRTSGTVTEWVQLTNSIVSSTAWHRVTIDVVFRADAGQYNYVRFAIDGSYVIDAKGYPNPAFSGKTGSWFRAATLYSGTIYTNFNSISFRGAGYMDDMQIVTNDPISVATMRDLVVTNTDGHGTPIPAVGTTQYADGSLVKCSVANSPQWNGTTQWVCNGWVGSGSVPALGSSTSTSFTITQNSSITWSWTTNIFTTNYTPYAWLAQHGLGTDDTTYDDGDGMAPWQEYIVGTDPTNGNSYFRIIEQQFGATSNYIRWAAGTNTSVTLPFGIYRSTNLLDGWGSSVFATVNRSSDPTGTNYFWADTSPPSVPAYYRVTATNVAK